MRASDPNGGLLISPLSQTSGLSRGLIQIEYMSDVTYQQPARRSSTVATISRRPLRKGRREFQAGPPSPECLHDRGRFENTRVNSRREFRGRQLVGTETVSARSRASSPTYEIAVKWFRVPSTPPFSCFGRTSEQVEWLSVSRRKTSTIERVVR